MWLEAVSESACIEAQCPTCGGGVRRRPYGEVYAGSFVLDGQRVEIRRKPAADFADPIILDPLTQFFDGDLWRLFPASVYFQRGQRGYLHRQVWIAAFGEIPAGCHIHHRDENPRNNQLSNLECVDASEHQRHTSARRRANGTLPGISAWAREAAAEWHRSEAGRLWHSRMARRTKSWLKWKRTDRPCEHCGKIVSMLGGRRGRPQRFCGNNCKSAAWRAKYPDYYRKANP
jgi:endogenous inhibitor of DNA gyrase (YacG/DUF329 family)